MNFNFEVENKKLRQKKSHKQKQNVDNLFCSFVFTTPEWKHLEKYVIFWNRKGRTTVRSLGRGMKSTCPIPSMVLNDLFFYIQVYSNDNILTRKTKVFMYEEVPVHNENKDSIEMLNHFFEQMEKKIDNIIYDDNKLLIYVNNELVKAINVVDERLLEKIFSGSAPQRIISQVLSEDSELAISSKAVYEALQNKLDKESLSQVAQTGDFNDLNNIPEEFPPTPHTHLTDDIQDWDDTVENDLIDLLDCLINEL